MKTRSSLSGSRTSFGHSLRIRQAAHLVVFSAAVAACVGLAGISGDMRVPPPQGCDTRQDPWGTTRAYWNVGMASTTGHPCGDVNENGRLDPDDVRKSWRSVIDGGCPNPPTISPAGIAEYVNQFPEICGNSTCGIILAGAAMIFQDEFGRMPYPGELPPIDGSNEPPPATGPCSSSTVPESPVGPFYPCESMDPTCDKVLDPGQDCTSPTCQDVIICWAGECDVNPPPPPAPENVVLMPMEEMFPWGFPPPPPDEGEAVPMGELIAPEYEKAPPEPAEMLFPWIWPNVETTTQVPEQEPVPYSNFVQCGTATANGESQDNSGEKQAESPAHDEDEASKRNQNKSCGSGGSAGGQGGSQVTTPNPVTVGWGHKDESATDVVVRLTGRDFRVVRSYTSNTDVQGAHPVGNNWTLSVFNGAYLRPDLNNAIRVYTPSLNRVVPFLPVPLLTGTWRPAGASNDTLTQTAMDVGFEVTTPVYKLETLGAGYRSYFRLKVAGENESWVNPSAALVGMIAEEADAYGNTARYEYQLFGPETNQTARLRRIKLYPQGGAIEAEIRFSWYIALPSSTQPTHPLHGKLARMQVIRFTSGSSPAAVETDRVEYTYKHGHDPFPSALGTNGDLIQVTRFNRVDAVLPVDNNGHAPGYPNRTFVTQYRYHDGIDHSNTGNDERLWVSGNTRQLKSVFEPEQIEYYAQKLHRTGALAHPTMAVRDAAFRLMLRRDDDRAFTDEADHQYSVADVASKLIGYNLSTKRVVTEFIQTSCGCSGGGSQGLKQVFSYAEWQTSGSTWPYGGRALKVQEYKYASGNYNTLHRTLCYDMAPQASDSDVPYLVNSVIKDTAGNAWVTHYVYDTERRVGAKFTPAAMSPSYTPASGTTPPSFGFSTSGNNLVFVYGYSATHRLSEMSVANGGGDTPQLVVRITYPSTNGTDTRTYLPSKVERFAVAGTNTEDEIQTTWYQYGFFSGSSDALAWRRTIAERERPSENGPESSDTGIQTYTPPNESSRVVVDSYQLFDTHGRLCWTRHADWSLTHREFDESNGPVYRPTRITYNADRSGISSSIWPSSLISTTGWGMKNGGSQQLSGGSLSWEYDYDLQGRVTAIRTPGGVERTFKREMRPLALDQVVELPGIYYYAKSEMPPRLTQSPNTYAGTANYNWFTAGGRVVSSASFKLDTDGDVVLPAVARRTLQYTLAGQLSRERVWHDISGNGYYDTTYAYDSLGRQESVTYANGTIVTNGEFDALGRVLSIKTGKGGTVTETSRNYFDDPNADSTPEQGVGNGNLSWTVQYAGENRYSGDTNSTSTAEIRTFRRYDFRNRLVMAQVPEAPHVIVICDNLGRPTEIGLFSSVPTFTSIPTTMPTTDRVAYLKYRYSQRGKQYQSLIATNPGGSGDFLGHHLWFDSVGRACAEWSPNSPRTKVACDGLGRVTTVWTTDGANDPAPGVQHNWLSACSVSDDVVLEQTDHHYDSRGREDLLTARARLHNGDGTGSLTDSNSVTSFAGTCYDAGDRPIRLVDFGTNQTAFKSGGAAPTSWPPSTPPEWNSSTWANQLITAVQYDARGLQTVSVDAEGKRTKSEFDALGRTLWTIANESGSTVAWSGRWTISGMSTTDPSLNQMTSYVYALGSNNAFSVTQYAHKLNSSGTEVVEATKYEFGTSLGASSNTMDSLVASGHLLSKVRLPDPSTGAPSGDSQTIQYAYDLQGEMRAYKDQNGIVHRLDRDMRHRVVKDSVAAWGTNNIDQSTTAIQERYNRKGQLDQVQTLSGTTVKNAAEFTYNSMGQVLKVLQQTDGVVTTSSPAVEYAYSISGSSNIARLLTQTYPHSGVLAYQYGTGLDASISRIKSISLSNLSTTSTSLVSYDYLGLDVPVGVDLPLIDVQLDNTMTDDGKRSIRNHTSQTNGLYGGWDRFGRVAQHSWVDGGLDWQGGSSKLPTRPPIILDLLTYDRTGSRLTTYDRRPGANRADRDAEHSYDGLHRLKENKRGRRESSTSWAAANDSQAFDMDQLGNWNKIKTDLNHDGAYTSAYEEETRVHDLLNRLASEQITIPASQPTRPLAYDAAGNLESQEKSDALTMLYVHDAWGRLVKVRQDLGNNVFHEVAAYEYNGLHWRTVKRVDTNGDGTLDQERKQYYNAAWQLVHEDVDDGYNVTSTAGINRRVQYFWGLRYIDDIVTHRNYETAPPGPSTTDDPVAEEVSLDYPANPTTPQLGAFFHLTDAQFSTVAILDSTGKLLERARYQPYGQAIHRWPGDFNRDGTVGSDDYSELASAIKGGVVIGDAGYEPDLDLNRDGAITSADMGLFNLWSGRGPITSGQISNPTGPDNRIGYAGYVMNPEALTYTVRNRHYEPILGRFMEMDPAGYLDGMNLYEYVMGMPIDSVDPSGLQSEATGGGMSTTPGSSGGSGCAASCKLAAIRSAISNRCGGSSESATSHHESGEPHVPPGVGAAVASGAGVSAYFEGKADKALERAKDLVARKVNWAETRMKPFGKTMMKKAAAKAATQTAARTGLAGKMLRVTGLRIFGGSLGVVGVVLDGRSAVLAFERGDTNMGLAASSSTVLGAAALGTGAVAVLTGAAATLAAPVAIAAAVGGAGLALFEAWDERRLKNGYDDRKNGTCDYLRSQERAMEQRVKRECGG